MTANSPPNTSGQCHACHRSQSPRSPVLSISNRNSIFNLRALVVALDLVVSIIALLKLPEDMSTETPLRILSLDGGGVRGISSLHVLQILMNQIKLRLITEYKALEPIPPLRPCHFFDLICGTSTGGLIALMLGRLEMV